MMPRKGAGRPRAVLATPNRTETQLLRRQAGSLRDMLDAPRTALRYRRALQSFFAYLKQFGFQLPRIDRDSDSCFSEYIEYCWQNGDGRSLACDSLSGAQWAAPALRGLLKGSWALCRAWQRCELPARAPPLPVVALFAMAEHLCSQGEPAMATLVLVGAHCLLRTGEIIGLRAGSIQFSADGTDAIIDLGDTKGGRRRGAKESVQVQLPWLVALLRAACRGKSPAEAVGPSPTTFRKLFDSTLRALQLHSLGFRPYSLRRGGATELWRQTNNLGQVTLRGRWGHAATARIYVNDGLARLAEFRMQEPCFKTTRDAAAAFGRRLAVPIEIFKA